MSKICPICLEEVERTQEHHVIRQERGGGDHRSNIVTICEACQETISFGPDDDAYPRQMACVWHQVAEYGLLFFLQYTRSMDDADKRDDLREQLRQEIALKGRRQVDNDLRKMAVYEYRKLMEELNAI